VRRAPRNAAHADATTNQYQPAHAM